MGRALLLIATVPVLVAACGYDWTVVPKDGKSSSSSGSSGSSDGVQCGTSTCSPSKSFCVYTNAQNDGECVPWTCSEHDCSCKETNVCTNSQCIPNKGGIVVVTCP